MVTVENQGFCVYVRLSAKRSPTEHVTCKRINKRYSTNKHIEKALEDYHGRIPRQQATQQNTFREINKTRVLFHQKYSARGTPMKIVHLSSR